MRRIATIFAFLFIVAGAFGQLQLVGISWVGWADEPDYEGVTGYADNPYNTPVVEVLAAPEQWDMATGLADDAGFDNAWNFLGDSMAVGNLTTDAENGDLFDLDDAATFGAAWKAMHHHDTLLVFVKYWDVNAQADADSRTFEIMAQPTAHFRHEPTFVSGGDSTNNPVAYQNMAYARMAELGGGKAAFANGLVSAYEASIASVPDKKAWIPFTTANWGNNERGLLGLAKATHYCTTDATDGTIRAVLVMSFAEALAYPVDPYAPAGDSIPLAVTDTIAFDVKSNATVTPGEEALGIGYFWASDKNNGYASNYYSGHLIMKDEYIVPVGTVEQKLNDVKVFVANDMLQIRGIELCDVQVYSITGSLVKTVHQVSNSLDMSDVADGLYIVKLSGIPSGFKVIK